MWRTIFASIIAIISLGLVGLMVWGYATTPPPDGDGPAWCGGCMFIVFVPIIGGGIIAAIMGGDSND